jgi:TPP-dependent pyruvate/acetoin dehydrogenase alpha subunit
MGIPAESADGQDPWSVREVVGRALERARAGEGPAFVEAVTYRYSGHGRGDPIQYRPEGELAAWEQRDPLDIARRRLADDHAVPERRLDGIAGEVDQQIREMTARALAAPFPEPDPRATEFATTGGEG